MAWSWRNSAVRITWLSVAMTRRVPYHRRLESGIDSGPPSEYRASMRIEVHDNQVESALKTMKKLMLKDGLFKEMKKRAYYEKPSVKRKRKQAEARKKRRKAMKRAEADD
jgi:small subunit ribosomal protein S21